METTKVKTCVFSKDYIKDGKTSKIHIVETEDGKTGQSWEELKEGQEVNIQEKEWNGNKSYTFYPVKDKPAGKGFPAKDWAYEKRRASLECAVELGKASGAKAADVVKVAELFFTYLNQK